MIFNFEIHATNYIEMTLIQYGPMLHSLVYNLLQGQRVSNMYPSQVLERLAGLQIKTTPLHSAAEAGSGELIDTLLEHGASIEAYDKVTGLGFCGLLVA